MLLLTSAALGGVLNAWPCSRMNWAWRNVWSTCSINSYMPSVSLAENVPAHFRRAPYTPTTAVHVDNFGVMTPQASPGNAGVGPLEYNAPHDLCRAMEQTATPAGSNAGGTQRNIAPRTLVLRNRCRRAIDAYGGIVHACISPPALQSQRGPISTPSPAGNVFYPDFSPQAGHVPHVSNVRALTTHALKCFQFDAGIHDRSPAVTCPGLLGWFNVVWNACGISRFGPVYGAPAYSPSTAQFFPNTDSVNLPNTQDVEVYQPNVVPLGGYLSPRTFVGPLTQAALPDQATTPAFVFCAPGVAADVPAASPLRWNVRGPNFRTSRCRRALDQFGRTANRCGGTIAPGTLGTGSGPSGTVGINDPLRLLFLGGAGGSDGNLGPIGLLRLAPVCN